MIRMLGGPLCPEVYAPLLSGQIMLAGVALIGPDVQGEWYLMVEHDDIRQARTILLERLNRALTACLEAAGGAS